MQRSPPPEMLHDPAATCQVHHKSVRGPGIAAQRILAGPAAPLSVRALPVGRQAPAAGARLPVVAVPFAAALSAPPGGDPLPAPGCQVIPVRLPLDLRMCVPVTVAGIRQAPPAAGAALPVGAVSIPATLHAQPGRAVPGAGAGRAGRQGAPSVVADNSLVGSTGNAYPTDPQGAGDARARAASGAPGAGREQLDIALAAHGCRASRRQSSQRT